LLPLDTYSAVVRPLKGCGSKVAVNPAGKFLGVQTSIFILGNLLY